MAELDKEDLAQMNEDYFKSLDKERLVEVAKNLHVLAAKLWEQQQQVESRESIISRPSLLDLYVKLSPHTAPETFSFCFCSCGYSRDKIRVLLQDCHDSSCYDFRLHDVDLLSHCQ